MKKYSEIKSPEELLEFMSNNIEYGYLGKSGRIYHYNDADFNQEWEKEYILESKEQILDTLVGNCWDQVELERDWFLNNNYEIKTFFEIVQLDYENNYPSHSFLVYKDKNKWNWFENADFNNRGIHSFNSLEELINFQYQKYLELLKEFNIHENEISHILLTEYSRPNSYINSDNYINHVINSKVVKRNR